jgi:hypothetical protein
MKKQSSSRDQLLPKAVADLYDVASHTHAIFAIAELGEVQLDKVSLDHAKILAEKGYLIKKERENLV